MMIEIIFFLPLKQKEKLKQNFKSESENLNGLTLLGIHFLEGDRAGNRLEKDDQDLEQSLWRLGKRDDQQQIRGQLNDVKGPSESRNLEAVVVPIAQFSKFS